MATYHSAKKQLAWAMQVLEDEIKAIEETSDTYERLLDNATEKGNEEDIAFWFDSFQSELTKLRVLKNVHFMIQHPDIHDENWHR